MKTLKWSFCAAISAALLVAAGSAHGQCTSYPNTLTNGTTADASQVMGNFNCAALTGAAHFTGSVGIGTTSPAATLDVRGTIQTLTNANGTLPTISSGVSAYGGSLIDWNGMSSTPGETDFINVFRSVSNTVSGGFAFFNMASNTAVNTMPLMYITAAGYVGIGMASPSNPLDVNGAVEARGGLLVSSVNAHYLYDDGADAVGLRIDNGATADAYFAFRSISDVPTLDGPGGALALATSGVQRLYIDGSGDVGIGTTSPTYPLYVNGTAYATGAAGALSDIRHKDKVKALAPGALTLVERLRPVTFVWKKPTDDGMKGEQIGFVAQEVEKVIPSVVLTENNTEKTKDLKYTELIPVLTKAIQEQQEEIKSQQARISTLEAEVEKLKPKT